MVSIPELFRAWSEFKRRKRKSKDLQSFERHLEDHLFSLHESLLEGTYQHGSYQRFTVFEPKKRAISKARVRDRLVHHLLYTYLVSLFDPLFIDHSFACRIGKGTHQGVFLLERLLRQKTLNGRRPIYLLKADIFRFFDHINHSLLKTLIQRKVRDERTLKLIFDIIDSFWHHTQGGEKFGIPLGNVTSQLFANLYLHELDFFVIHQLKMPYIRFCDDFLLLSHERKSLEKAKNSIEGFLKLGLLLTLHPQKIFFRKDFQGIDFLGYVTFVTHRLLRTKTKRRLKNRLSQGYGAFLKGNLAEKAFNQKLQSYLGLLSHTDEKMLAASLKNAYAI